MFNRRYAYNEHKINIETVPKLSLKWKFYANKDITATPTIYNDTIYFPSWNGNIYAIKQIDGSLVWKQNLEKLTGLNTTGFIINANWTLARATPTVAEDLLIVGIYGPAVVIGLERRTGELVWLTHLDNHPAAVVTLSGTYYNGLAQLHPLSLLIFFPMFYQSYLTGCTEIGWFDLSSIISNWDQTKIGLLNQLQLNWLNRGWFN